MRIVYVRNPGLDLIAKSGPSLWFPEIPLNIGAGGAVTHLVTWDELGAAGVTWDDMNVGASFEREWDNLYPRETWFGYDFLGETWDTTEDTWDDLL